MFQHAWFIGFNHPTTHHPGEPSKSNGVLPLQNPDLTNDRLRVMAKGFLDGELGGQAPL
jgi:hypothetical protein